MKKGRKEGRMKGCEERMKEGKKKRRKEGKKGGGKERRSSTRLGMLLRQKRAGKRRIRKN